MKIVVLDGYTENPGDLSWEEVEKLGNLTVYDRIPDNNITEIIKKIGDAEIILTNKTPITKAVFEACPNIRYVGVLATGYNVVDTEAAKEKQIPVTNIPTYGTAAVAQFTVGLLLEICHRIGHHSQAVKSGKWSKNPDWCFWDYPLIELEGKTAGIIGFGKIGQKTATILKAMGMNILAFDEFPNESGRRIGTYVTLEELLERSDVISLHCPLFPTTEGIINKDTIAKMKERVILLNTSRGPLIVEEDLAIALHTKKIYAAGLDVLVKEPAEDTNPLLGLDNCFMTPHIAWAPKESRQRLLDVVVENIKSFLRGENLNTVNM